MDSQPTAVRHRDRWSHSRRLFTLAVVSLVAVLAVSGAYVASGLIDSGDQGRANTTVSHRAASELIVVSDTLRSDGYTGPVGGVVRTLSVDGTTPQFALDATVDVHAQAIASRVHQRIYLASESVSAIDVVTGAEIWRTSAPHRIRYMSGLGPPAIVESTDGRWLYVYNSNMTSKTPTAEATPYWVDIIDATTGKWVAKTDDILGCGPARLLPTPERQDLLVLCYSSNKMLSYAITGQDQNVVATTELDIPGTSPYLGLPGRIVDGALSPDGGKLYVVVDTLSVATVNTVSGSIENVVALSPGNADPIAAVRAIGLSPDGSQLFVTVQLERQGVTDSGQMRSYATTSWSETGRVAIQHMPMIIPLVFDSAGEHVYVVTYQYIDGSADPIQSNVVEIDVTNGTATTVYSGVRERILQAVPLS